jgi:hypothetical protein
LTVKQKNSIFAGDPNTYFDPKVCLAEMYLKFTFMPSDRRLIFNIFHISQTPIITPKRLTDEFKKLSLVAQDIFLILRYEWIRCDMSQNFYLKSSRIDQLGCYLNVQHISAQPYAYFKCLQNVPIE